MPSLISAFEAFMRMQADAFSPDVRNITRNAIEPKGKYIRPILTFSSAGEGACAKDSLVRRAAIGELIHLSTLIHDDVIDGASIRRNAVTPNKKYGAHGAILLGDAVFARVIQLVYEENDNLLLGKIGKCILTICEGEMVQTLVNREKNITKSQYFESVYGKTGVLFSLACSMGADCVGRKSDAWTAAAAEAGKQLGIAYQIYDDMCDWSMSEADAGKTLGTDLASGKHTFPLIALLEKLPEKRAKTLERSLGESDPEEILQMMRQFGAVKECEDEFLRRVDSAERAIEKFGDLSAPLKRFCVCMRKLKFA